MDCVIPTHDRPGRLACTLSTLLLQQFSGPRQLHVVDNSRHDVCEQQIVRKTLRALEATGWAVHHVRSEADSLLGVKKEAIRQGHSESLCLIDNDVLFTRPDTISSLQRVLREYDVAAVSPVAYDVDADREVVNPFVAAYDRHPIDANGVTEGDIALGLCLALRRDDLNAVMKYWIDELPYMEDQVLVHFLKKRRGYAYLRHHVVLHMSYDESPSYVFDDDEVVRCLERRCAVDSAYEDLLDLRRELKDGAEFSRSPGRRE